MEAAQHHLYLIYIIYLAELLAEGNEKFIAERGLRNIEYGVPLAQRPVASGNL